MQPPSTSDQLCDICGSKSNSELITTCSSCHKSHEHIYCMRAIIRWVPESWYCEACRFPNPVRVREEVVQDSFVRQETCSAANVITKVPEGAKMLRAPFGKRSARVLSRNFVPKKVETGKVKFLSLEDIYASGSKTKVSSLESSIISPMGAKSSPENNHSYRSTAYQMPLSVARVQTTSPKQAGVCFQEKYQKHSGKVEPLPHKVQTNSPKQAVVCAQEKHEKHSGKVEPLPLKSQTPREIPVNGIVYCTKHRTSKPKACFKFGKEDLPNPPAVEASWKGSFEVVDFPHEMYEGFQAYPPEKVLSKAYLASKAMPGILQFTMQPRQYVWREVFNTESPCGFDIALYFWPDDFCRSKYNHLLELMDKQDLSIKSRLDGVELLIFTSRQLPAESRRLNKQFYLWGIYRSLKERTSSVNLKGKERAVNIMFSSYKIGDCSASAPHEAVDQVVDMEIDMVGGREVGTIDKFLTTPTSLRFVNTTANPPGLSKSIIKMETPPAALIVEPPPSFSRSMALMKISPAAIKVEPPPGFSNSITPMKMPPAALNVGPPPGFTKPTTLVKTQPIALSVDPPPGFSNSTSLVKMQPVALSVDPPPGFSNSITLVKTSPSAHKVDTPPGLSRPIKLEKSDFSSQGLGTDQKLTSDTAKHNVVTNPTIRDSEDVKKDELFCMVCHEGYSSKPNDMLGIYCYTKRVNPDTSTSTSSHNEFIYTTTTHFNIIHFQCHFKSMRSTATLQNLKTEWEGATIRNNGNPCNCIFPLKGPSVPMLQYLRIVDQYWNNLNKLGQPNGNRLRLLTYNISQILAEFVTNGENKERESNSRFLLFMIQMARHLVDQGNSTSRTEETTQVMMVNSLLFESHESWLTHRRTFLRRGIYQAYLKHNHGQSRSLDLYAIIKPVLVYTGLIEQLQSFFKFSDDSNGLQSWEVIMKEKLVNVKKMLGFSEDLMSWLDDMLSSVDLQEAFFIMGGLPDVLADGFFSCEDFVQAVIQDGKMSKM